MEPKWYVKKLYYRIISGWKESLGSREVDSVGALWIKTEPIVERPSFGGYNRIRGASAQKIQSIVGCSTRE